MYTLVITINGPFAYLDDSKKGNLRLMAPMCPQHRCVISSIEPRNQYVIEQYNRLNHKANYGGCKSCHYELGFTHHASKPSVDPSFLPCTPTYKTFHPERWRFWLSLPWPNIIVPVDPVPAQIIKSGTPGKQANYAIGAQLIYACWDGKPIPLLLEGKPIRRKGDRSPVEFKFGHYDSHSYLDIDFSSPLRDDPEHEDAVSCFGHLMSALELNWSMYIDSAPVAESSRLNDCRAAVAWIS
jgi:hypothetical protein